jgi:AcrR family transcriptional regulator
MPRGDRSTGTRQALLRAAARVFVTRGPYGARVREIAREAGLTVPALYYHFEGTEQLYDRVVADGRVRFRELVEAALATPGGARPRLLALAEAYVLFGREDPIRLRLLCIELFRPKAESDDIEEMTRWLQGNIEAVIADGMATGELPRADVPTARRLFMATLNGLLVDQARSPEMPLLDDRLAARTVSAFVDGLGGVTP